MQNYHLEFILHTNISSDKTIENYLAEFAQDLVVEEAQDTGEKGRNFKISLSACEPTVVFDICSQFGRIRSVKINSS